MGSDFKPAAEIPVAFLENIVNQNQARKRAVAPAKNQNVVGNEGWVWEKGDMHTCRIRYPRLTRCGLAGMAMLGVTLWSVHATTRYVRHPTTWAGGTAPFASWDNAASVQAARRLGEPADGDFSPPWQAVVKRYDWGWIAEVLIDPRAALGAIMPNVDSARSPVGILETPVLLRK